MKRHSSPARLFGSPQLFSPAGSDGLNPMLSPQNGISGGSDAEASQELLEQEQDADTIPEVPFARPQKIRPNQFSGTQKRRPISYNDEDHDEVLGSLDIPPYRHKSQAAQPAHQRQSRRSDRGSHRHSVEEHMDEDADEPPETLDAAPIVSQKRLPAFQQAVPQDQPRRSDEVHRHSIEQLIDRDDNDATESLNPSLAGYQQETQAFQPVRQRQSRRPDHHRSAEQHIEGNNGEASDPVNGRPAVSPQMPQNLQSMVQENQSNPPVRGHHHRSGIDTGAEVSQHPDALSTGYQQMPQNTQPVAQESQDNPIVQGHHRRSGIDTEEADVSQRRDASVSTRHQQIPQSLQPVVRERPTDRARHRHSIEQHIDDDSGVDIGNEQNLLVPESQRLRTRNSGMQGNQSWTANHSDREAAAVPKDGHPLPSEPRGRHEPDEDRNQPTERHRRPRPFHDADNSLPSDPQQSRRRHERSTANDASSSRRRDPDGDRRVERPIVNPGRPSHKPAANETPRPEADDLATEESRKHPRVAQVSRMHFESLRSQAQTPVGDLSEPRPTPPRRPTSKALQTSRRSFTTPTTSRRHRALRNDRERHQLQPSRPLKEVDVVTQDFEPRRSSRVSHVSKARSSMRQQIPSALRVVDRREQQQPQEDDKDMDPMSQVRYLREMACRIETEQWKRRARDTNAHVQKCQEEKERRAAKEEELRGRLNLINFEMLRKEDQVKELKTELAKAELDKGQMRAEIETSQVAQANLQLRIEQAEEEKTKSVKKAGSVSKKRWKVKEQQLRATIRSLEGDMEQEKGDLEAEISALREKEILFQKQSEDASIKTKNLELNIEKLKDSYVREGEKAKLLQEQLAEHKKREDSVQRLEKHLTSISTKVEKLTEKSAETDGVSSNVMDRLDKLLELVQSAPRAPDTDAIGGILKEFQDQVVSNFAKEVKQMTTAQSDVQGKIQSIQECLRNQSILVTEHKEQQQQLLQSISKQGGDNAGIWQLLRSKEDQFNKTANAVIEMRQRFEAFIKTSEDHDRGGVSEADLRAAEERLRESEAKVAQLETNLRSEHTTYEARETILKERLEQLEESRGSMERETTEERTKVAKVSTKNQKLEKSLADANQRVCNLTMKLRDAQTAQKDPTDINEKTPQELEKELKEQHKVIGLCHKMLEDIQQARAREVAQQTALASEGCNEVTKLQEPGSSSSSQRGSQSSTANKNAWDRNDDEIEVPRTAPVAEADKDYEIVISDDSDDSDDEDDVLVPDTQLDERAVQVKRLVMRSPVEEPDQSPEPPSVAEERQKRRSSTNPGSGPNGILRRTTSSLQPAAIDAPALIKELSLTTHAGHTRYNRPVGSGDAIAGAQFVLPRGGNRTGKSRAGTAGNARGAGILSSPFLMQIKQQGVKRAQSQPPDYRQQKRSKSVYDELSSDDPLSSSCAHESDRINADETVTENHTLRSPHFQKGKETTAATQNLKQGLARQPLAEKTPAPQQPPSSSIERRILKTYSKAPETDEHARAKVSIF